MSINIEWKINVDLDAEDKSKKMKLIEVEDHPLKIPTVTERIPRRILGSQPSTGRSTPVTTPSVILDLNAVLEGIDPLTKFAIEEIDPLTKAASEMTTKEILPFNTKKSKEKKHSFDMEPWNARKGAILAKFTTSEKLSIVTSFLSDGDKVVVKAQSTVIDKVQHRLEQLDCIEEDSQSKLNVSQAEYIGKIEQLNKDMVTAWNSEQKVKSLRIAIQCAKMLADTDVMKFYPSKFVLITDILDIFGQIVYERLRLKADFKSQSKVSTPLPEDFTPDMVSEAAKETCRNWFYKIASIRELVPRIYVEMAILKSYSFLTASEFSVALLRLIHMIRGIGNPLVAIYARCYLCRVGIAVTNSKNEMRYLVENFYDFLETYDHLYSKNVRRELTKQQINYPIYLTLFTPALDFILQAMACDVNENFLSQLLDKCKNLSNSSLLLNSIMTAFKPVYVANRALQFLEMLSGQSEENFPPHVLIRTLGLCISICPPPSEHRRQVLSSAFRHISALAASEDYVNCLETWIQYIVQYYGIKELNVIIGDLINHVEADKGYNCSSQLKKIVEKILSNVQDFEAFLSMNNFLPFIDIFKDDIIKVEVCKSILSSCSNYHTSDPVTVNTLMYICSVLHDSVNMLMVDDEKRQIGELLCNVIRKVNYGRDFEQQLSFYVEARGMFSNIDSVLSQLVQCVNTLSVNRRYEVKGYHTRKTGAFVRACAAYCYITIPSIQSFKTKLELYLLSGQVALFNNCLGQADSCFRTALKIIPEYIKSEENKQRSDNFLTVYTRKFLSVLLIVPDNPDQSILNFTGEFLNEINQLWNQHDEVLCQLCLNVLDLLRNMAQESYLYHVDKVESNDTLYGSDPKFISRVNRMSSVILNELLLHLNKLGHCRKQSTLSLELVVRVTLQTDLNDKSMAKLALNLWQLCLKGNNVDMKYMACTKEYLRMRALRTNNIILQQLVDKMVLNY